MRGSAKWILWILLLAFVGGFLVYETSGLIGLAPVTPTTAVATVNGQEILYRDYEQRVQSETQQAQQQGRSLSEDDVRSVRNRVFEDMVTDVLLQQEYRRRNIVVTDDEIREYARYAPPPWIQQAPDLQTDGRFDLAKYQRLLTSPAARQQGLLASLEAYYRSEVPRNKLVDQLAATVYVTDSELWRMWADQNDSAQVTYVALRPTPDTAFARTIADGDLRTYFNRHKDRFRRQGRAVLSVLEIPREITAADSAATRARIEALRAEITSGRATFEDVARRESTDSVSGQQGGDLGRGPRGRFVTEFENAAFALPVGQVSGPVLTPFGYHLIKVDARVRDTIAVRHILLRIQQSDSNAIRIDRRADSLARIAANAEDPARLDSAAKQLGLIVRRVTAVEDEPAQFNGRIIPSVSAWSFSGVKAGETSDLFDDETGYYIARLDSLTEGGEPRFEDAREEVRQLVAFDRQLERMLDSARAIATAAAGSTLEQAAQARGLTPQQTPLFTRGSFVPGLGQYTPVIGQAFGLPVGAVGQPSRSDEAVFVIRVDRRVPADSAGFATQKAALRQQRLQQMRQQRIQLYLQDLRKSADVDDRRKEIDRSLRRQS